MPFPKYEEMDEPLLSYIFLNGGPNYEVYPRSTYEPLANFFGLTKEERKRPRPDGYSGSYWQNRVQWARQRLINRSYLDGKTRGIWKLTPQGIQCASRIACKFEQLKKRR